jgi:CheY-like chemotaxis protein
VRLLFAADEPDIILPMTLTLRHHGYNLTVVGSVAEALAEIKSTEFDILISDLNIGEAGDGFTVVSAMRRTQPNCMAIILTEYPGFDSALEAVRSQADDYLLKPADIPALIELIDLKLSNPKPGTGAATRRISQVLREETFEITQRALSEMKSAPALRAIPITNEQRIEHTARTIEELATMLESAEPEQATREFIQGAAMQGARRYQLGYTVPLLAAHVRILEHAIFDVIHERLLSLNLNYFMFDLKRLNDGLGLYLEHMLIAYVKAEQRIEHQTGTA